MINKKEIVAMLLAGGQGSRLFALTQKKANQPYPMVENIRSLTSHCQTVQTQELTQSEF